MLYIAKASELKIIIFIDSFIEKKLSIPTIITVLDSWVNYKYNTHILDYVVFLTFSVHTVLDEGV